MEQLTIGLAIAALILSVVAILFEVFFYRWQTQQGQSITERVTTFAEKMHELLGELRGLSTRTHETQERQFQSMLDVMVAREARVQADVQAETEPPVSDMIQRIGHIEELVQQSPQSERLREELGEMRSAIATLQTVIPEVVARSVRSVSRDTVRRRDSRPWVIVRDLSDQPLAASSGSRLEKLFSDTYDAPLDWFVRRGYVDVIKEDTFARLAVTPKGLEYAASDGNKSDD
jgi:hypothetical protein